MVENKIEHFERKSQLFKPVNHFISRIDEMKNQSKYGAEVASKWTEIVNQQLKDEIYPVVHPMGQETFSIYSEFPTGVFEYALDIDGATSLIKEQSIKPETFAPSEIIVAVDEDNINKETNNIKTNHQNPVIVLQSKYLTNNKPYCINGNHRIFEASRSKKERIEVYVFKDLEFTPFFYNVLSKAVYFLEMDYMNVISNKRTSQKDGHTDFAHLY